MTNEPSPRSPIPSSNKQKSRVVVVGAGIGGLTAGALLAKQGYEVTIFDQAIVPGGCASTFKRRGFTFDVGATQVAGLELGGIHHRIFEELEIEPPTATFCDPACGVFLPGETTPINVWRDADQWQAERQKQFPGSEPFWNLLNRLFQASWRFQGRDPVLPPRSVWDVWQLISAVRPDTLITVPFTLMTVADALKLYGLYEDKRLKTFLDLQLKLYSQVGTDETALLYAATALAVSQSPQGLFHLEGSMQVLSDRLVAGLEKYGGKLLMGHTVEEIHTASGKVAGVTVRNQKTGEIYRETADEVVANVTAQNLVKLTKDKALNNYRRRVDKIPQPSGAFVVYLGVKRSAIPANCSPHLQFLYNQDETIGENNSLFVSVSKPGDGRAPEGQATLIASSFTDADLWWKGDDRDYAQIKQQYTDEAISRLGAYFDLGSENIIYVEAATPRTFARYTARDKGIVGGLGQRIATFGPFGFANRTPIKHLWLVGDSTHPGEGTAGVSYSAYTVVRQIEAMSN
ncbi:C-3',4' desaturase CrtD [Waterburya agarophytonicola K14]|uniref:C-3',4' desaturase CrtD n=1 Tax=Waterburya agarophytonicola KI4 TaxID=2874699 RepID=A0A964FGI6_9CYAN|nr:C-3',4' desaturase CrtD [Waterburya agarophytonicola]MCC0178930.1 C-3',4' desaturase CrtD [Waterburya agarophytonicola KI4]